MVCLKGEIVITIRPYDTLYLLRSETHLNKDCTVLHSAVQSNARPRAVDWSEEQT